MAKTANKTGIETSKPSRPPKTADDRAKKPMPPRESDDDDEDGDFATPKRDRYGNDDEPL
ncbi:hypothetical protein JQ617_37700 [Bradyrhizobium sp. KB893862 SZCCT0404]|uniref:hypothetical protein n=1 Tax=Bradyrhizobium sp. KB893862 SZCCT0404 TaxID=2807672 RepID=UPI001BAD51EE|nr:hypothetical protein [Bradyrhizobium sp. KB893862 SZCCT0404]MBR1179752.1 hypothetical protein [Bradyrhizobium sp. KB893862 SZCCT0404]